MGGRRSRATPPEDFKKCNLQRMRFQGPPMMNSNICWLLVRLAILLGILLVRSSEEATYRDFQKRHIDFPKTEASSDSAYCNTMMALRQRTLSCKPTNTFINASPTDVQQVCGSGGRRYRKNLYDSLQPFPVVVCRIKVRSSPDSGCQYTGQSLNKRVRLACVKKLPVHFKKLL
ncbi:ribonuclease pancreatic-like [Tiliqua scincoides]|uniref:ribonuclease pancreatic-like n=1 Tax=Tiliqua scincoides TaxID=71010 RepID=UPI0034637A57